MEKNDKAKQKTGLTRLLQIAGTKKWWLIASVISAAVIPLVFPVMFLSRKIITLFGEKHQNVRVETSSRMLEYLQGMRLIKAFNLVGTKFDRMEKTFRKLKSLSIKLEAGTGPTVVLGVFVLQGGLTLIILFGLTFLFAGDLSLPVYIMFLIIGARVYEPLIQVMMYLGELAYFQLSVERIEELRKTPVLTGSNPGLKPGRFDINFQNVSFRYHDTDVLKNINLSIAERSLVAIVGPSGSGKTTMTRLIARFWDVAEGRISLGGRDLREYDPDDLLEAISIVFQDVYLFNDSIINNIRVGKKDVGEQAIMEAAKQARCHDFISKLPEGYQTMVGEGGATLSGAERQRVSIARAILKDSSIVLLDEATASLDLENELYIQAAINRLVEFKTVIVIAHRLNTVVNADKIVVLDNGSIVEEGTHPELMKLEGLYQSMWDEQQKVRSWKF